jgi:hypothetical protein
MRKQIALGASILFGVFAISAGACSSTTSSGSGPADSSTIDHVVPDSGPVADAGGDPACFDPSSVLSFTTTPLAPKANQGACASDDLINQFLAACISTADAGTTAADSGDAAAVDPCEAYIDANASCALCLGGYSPADAGTPPNSPWPALLQVDSNGDVLPAVAACIAAISTGTDTCKLNYATDDLCTQTGCGACSDTDYSGCATAESTDPTTTCLTSSPLDSACQAAINGVSSSDADSKCGASTQIQSQTDFANVFLLVGKTLCE